MALPTVRVNGVDIHYQTLGHGPDVIMIHGLATNLAFWYMKIVPLLTNDYRVTVYDLRGHGLSSMPGHGYTTKDLAEDLHGTLEQTGVKKVHLVGHSLGGAIALHYAVLHPERVSSLALIDCRIHALQPFRSPEESPYWMRRREALRAKRIPVDDDMPKVVYMMLEELTPLVQAGIANPNALGGFLAPSGGWDPNSRAARRWKELVGTTTFAKDIRKIGGLTRQTIKKVTHPTLLSYGGDSFCLETCKALEAIVVNHRSVIHPGMGHFFPVLAPELLVEDLRGFFSELHHRPKYTIA